MESKTKIKTIREQKGLSQRELARMIDVPHSQISRYENGQHMNEETIKKICKALEINADYFLGLTEENIEKDWKILSLFFVNSWYGIYFLVFCINLLLL